MAAVVPIAVAEIMQYGNIHHALQHALGEFGHDPLSFVWVRAGIACSGCLESL